MSSTVNCKPRSAFNKHFKISIYELIFFILCLCILLIITNQLEQSSSQLVRLIFKFKKYFIQVYTKKTDASVKRTTLTIWFFLWTVIIEMKKIIIKFHNSWKISSQTYEHSWRKSIIYPFKLNSVLKTKYHNIYFFETFLL